MFKSFKHIITFLSEFSCYAINGSHNCSDVHIGQVFIVSWNNIHLFSHKQSGRLRICAAEGASGGRICAVQNQFLIFFWRFWSWEISKKVLQIFLSDSDRQTLVLGDHFGNDFLVKIMFQTFFLFFWKRIRALQKRICAIRCSYA